MPLTKEERIELLVKAREKKRLLAVEKKSKTDSAIPEVKPIEEKKEVVKKKETNKVSKDLADERSLDLTLLDDINKEEPEVKNEVIRIKAPKKKKIIKRVIEVEEPSSDEEIQEEIVKIPRSKKDIVYDTNEKNPKSIIDKRSAQINQRLFNDIFPNN